MSEEYCAHDQGSPINSFSDLAVHAGLQDASQVHRGEEVPVAVVPWHLGDAAQPARLRGVLLRHGRLLPALLLGRRDLRDVHDQLQQVGFLFARPPIRSIERFHTVIVILTVRNNN